MLYEVTVINRDGIDGVVYSSSGMTFQTSHPMNDNSGTNPEELLASAWATCLNATIQALLSARGYKNIESYVRVQVLLEQDTVGYCFKIKGFASIATLDEALVEKIVNMAHLRCPVSKIMGDYTHLTLEIEPFNIQK